MAPPSAFRHQVAGLNSQRFTNSHGRAAGLRVLPAGFFLAVGGIGR
jgi:hypothetical protein